MTLAGLVATILSIASATAGALLMSSDRRIVSRVSSWVWCTSNGAGISAPPDDNLGRMQSLAQPPLVRRPGFVSHLVEHRLGYVNPHASLGQRVVVELGRELGDLVDIER